MTQTRDLRLFRRVQAVLIVACGGRCREAAELVGGGERAVALWIDRYLQRHRIEDLADAPRSGRPPAAGALTDEVLAGEFGKDPQSLGYRATTWTVPLLAGHLTRQCSCWVSQRTLRRRMQALGLAWKRPRHVFKDKADHLPQKRGHRPPPEADVRRSQGRGAVVYGLDAVASVPAVADGLGFWRGRQVEVPISGYNARRALFGTIDVRTGHRVVLRRSGTRQADFQAFLRKLRSRYRRREVWLLLDRAPCQTAPRSQALAAVLGIKLVWLPKQASANQQYEGIEEHADEAERWVLTLTSAQALRKAGMLSPNFWLKLCARQASVDPLHAANSFLIRTRL